MARESANAKRLRTQAILAELAKANPSPTTELDYGNPYQLLVAVVLSAQATDKGVNKATKGLFTQVTTPQHMVALGEDALLTHIKTIGLYRAKGKNVIALSQQLISHHNGEVPRNREELERLPGVGRKTANVVLNTVWGEPTMAVDTHVFRVAHRLGLSRGKTPRAVEDDLMALLPPAYAQHAHHWFILHGRYTCTARAPKCASCPVNHLCPCAFKTS
jgi:endonuclease-3